MSSIAQNITDQMTHLYVFVDNFLKTHLHLASWRRLPNNAPAFTDAEVITVALMQGCFQVATLKRTYRLIADNFHMAFPQLPTHAQWLARFHALAPLVGRLIQYTLPPSVFDDGFYIMDSKLIPTCKPIRHGIVRLLREDGACFGKGTAGWFFGFKLHVLVHGQSGALLCAFLAPANLPDKGFAPALAQCVDGGVTLADRAYQAGDLSDWLRQEEDMALITPANCGQEMRPFICSLRERIETSFGQLHDRFVTKCFHAPFTAFGTRSNSKCSISICAKRDYCPHEYNQNNPILRLSNDKAGFETIDVLLCAGGHQRGVATGRIPVRGGISNGPFVDFTPHDADIMAHQHGEGIHNRQFIAISLRISVLVNFPNTNRANCHSVLGI